MMEGAGETSPLSAEGQKRRGRPPKAQPEPETGHRMRVTAENIQRGSGRVAVKGDVVMATDAERTTWLFWGKAQDA